MNAGNRTQPIALVTGAVGFTGRHLVKCLVDSGYQVVGLDQQEAAISGAILHVGDIADAGFVRSLLAVVQPTVIFHLAALTNPRLDYPELHRVNAVGTLVLLEAVRQVCPDAIVLITSTSAVYGQVPAEALPIGEDQPFRPVTRYAVSKIAQEMLAYQQFAEHELRVIRSRAFNLTGPGESPHFVTSAFARQIAMIEAGRQPPFLYVGNLETVRDLTDIRDAVHAYRLLTERGEPGMVYNVCSGKGTVIRSLLDEMLALARVSNISVRLDPARLQPADVPIQVGDATRLQQATGWRPTIPFRQTVQDVLDFWRKRIDEER